MNNDNQSSKVPVQVSENALAQPSPLRCLIGSVIAAGLAVLLYMLTTAIAQTFAAKGIQTDNLTAQRISVAVRTLVVGLSALATGIFGMAAIGLLGLAVQLVLQGLKGHHPPANS